MLTVGELRQQTALCNTDRKVVIIPIFTNNTAIVNFLKVIRCYPDTVDENGRLVPTFKIEVEIE